MKIFGHNIFDRSRKYLPEIKLPLKVSICNFIKRDNSCGNEPTLIIYLIINGMKTISNTAVNWS